jgi:hypothetical protein
MTLCERANSAMRFAKEHQKNCVATYATERMTDGDLIIASFPKLATGTT